jgi:pimeloyl-ACP methyl ester carboxylesterase
VDEVKLAVKEFGKGGRKGDVILIHGTGARAEMWSPQIELLVNDGWRLVVPDLRGHGNTDEPGVKTDVSMHINDMLETLEQFEIGWPAIFVGHSLGSIISIELAAKFPERVSKILAVSFPGRVPWITVSAFKVFLQLPYQSIRDTVIHRSLPWRERVLIATNQHSLNQVVENFADLDYVSEMPQVKCPVHFAVGRLDPVAPAKYVEAIHNSMPGSTLQVIEWAGHNCMDSQPAAFNRWFMAKMNDSSC